MNTKISFASARSPMDSCDLSMRAALPRDQPNVVLASCALATIALLLAGGCDTDDPTEDAETDTSPLSTPPPPDDGATVAWLLGRCSQIQGPALPCVCAHAARPALIDFCRDTWAQQPAPSASASAGFWSGSSSSSSGGFAYDTPDEALSAVEAILEADRIAEEKRVAAKPSKATGLDLTPREPCVAALGCAPERKVVFVSSQKYAGNLGGLAGADDKCNELARAAALTGTFKAWLSSSSESAASRLSHADVPYFLTNGTRIANGWSDLVDGGLLAGIHVTERQDSVPAEQSAWSNSVATGAVASTSPNASCASFSSSSSAMMAATGGVDFVGTAWSQRSKKACSAPQRLYCIEQ